MERGEGYRDEDKENICAVQIQLDCKQWFRPVTPILRRLRQEDCESQPTLHYMRRPSRKPPPMEN